MSLFQMVQQVSLFALFTVLVGLVPLGVAALYAWRPAEQWLALMRPLSLAAIFAGLGSFLSGASMVLAGIGATPEFGPGSWRNVSIGAAEALTPMLIIFACLTIAWLLVAVGMRRVDVV